MAGGMGVSVLGAGGQYQTLLYDRNLALAQQLAASINLRVLNGQLIPSNDMAATVPAGSSGEYVQTLDGMTHLPTGYAAVVDNAAYATISGAFRDDTTVMAGAGNLDFNAKTGGGTVVGGAGSDTINFGHKTGDWTVALGNGDDLVKALGGGNTQLDLGTGMDTVMLGRGSAEVTLAGAATVFAGTGAASIQGQSNLTFFGGKGDAVVSGGKEAQNLLVAGAGNETLIGGQDSLGGQDTFVFTRHHASTTTISDFGGSDKVVLQGFGWNEIAKALASETTGPNGTTITLSDHTQITFAGSPHLDADSFTIVPPHTIQSH